MIPFTKMHGLGNDFILVDAIRTPIKPSESEALSRQMNHRKFGIGGDGLILAERGEAAPFKMLMYNPDGSESEMCGNGIRCFAKFVRAKGYTSDLTIPVETGAGLLELQLQENGQVRVDMGPARFRRGDIPVAGSPEGEFIEIAGLAGTGPTIPPPAPADWPTGAQSQHWRSPGEIRPRSPGNRRLRPTTKRSRLLPAAEPRSRAGSTDAPPRPATRHSTAPSPCRRSPSSPNTYNPA